MVIKNRFLKFSSLCIVGGMTVTFGQLPTVSASQKIAKVDKVYSAEGTSAYEFSAEGEILSGIENVTLSELNLKDEKTKKIKIDTKMPSIPGLDGKNIDLSKYQKLAIVNVKGKISIRKDAGNNMAVAGYLYENSACYVKGKKKADGKVWYHIESGGIKGFVPAESLITGDEALAKIAKVGRYVAKATCDVLNVRKKPSTNAEILYTIDKNEKLEVLSVKDDWVEVNTDLGNDKAYVSKEYVDISYELREAIDVDENSMIGFSSGRTSIEKNCHQYIGNRYISGGTSLITGADCSGFTQSLYKKYAGISLPRLAAQQSKCGKSVKESELRPGDLVFYYNGSGHVTHVAIYIGQSKGKARIIHSSNHRDGVKYSNMAYSPNRFYRNVLGD